MCTRELDEGRYLCSMPFMDRIARAPGQSRDGRQKATHLAAVKPELDADAEGVSFYDVIEIYSRSTRLGSCPSSRNRAWLRTSSPIRSPGRDWTGRDGPGRDGAAHRACRSWRVDDIQAGVCLAADLGATRTHSGNGVQRQSVLRIAIHTLMYLPNFTSLAHAKRFPGRMLLPEELESPFWDRLAATSSVHFGTADAIAEARQQPLTADYHANLARFGRRPSHPQANPGLDQPTRR